MRRASILVTLFLLAPLWANLDSHAAAETRVAIVQTEDQYTNLAGMSEFLASEEIEFVDLSEDFRAARVLDLSHVDLLIVGSFVTNDAAMRETYLSAGDTLRKFVADGGVLAVLCQADQDLETEKWMEPPRRITRADPDYGTAFITQSHHPLLKKPEQITAADLRGWRVPATWPKSNTVWEEFSDWQEGGVLLGTTDTDPPATAAVVEMGWGSGRVLFFAMAPDKAFVGGNDESRSGGTKLLRNLLAYAELVRGGQAPPVEITPTPGFKHPIRGTVYLDENRDGKRDESEEGLAGIVVSDGFNVVRTDESGAYHLPNSEQNAFFVFVHQSDQFKQSGQAFFHRLPFDATADQRFDFCLQPAENADDDSEGVRFVQLTDSHVRNVSDRDYMRQATAEIYAMNPQPDFVVATGDLVDWGVDEHFQNYLEGMVEGDGEPPVPYFNVFGNHEIVFGPIERYYEYIGPDYYSFERAGILFVSLNCVTPSARQDAWLEETLQLLGKERPVVIFQHFPPSRADLERFAGMGVKSVFSGHWHSEKEMEHADVQSVNSPPLIMGGIDASPAGFKLVHMAADGTAETEWRYGFQKQRLTIVSPQEGTPMSNTYFPIIVNAYDTSSDVASVKWRLGSADGVAGTLSRSSAMSWDGAYRHAALAPGSYPFRVEARDQHGEVWTADQQVEAIPGEPAPPAPRGQWPMFMGNAAHTGAGAELVGKLPLRLAWSVDTGGDSDFASPILADGRLYLALKKRTLNRTNGVAAFDPVTGEQLWQFETPMAINHTPAFSDGILCVAEMGGRVYGVDAATGERRWHHDLIDNRGRYSYCAPAVHDGHFYAGVMRRMARLRPQDGHVEWEEQIGGGDNDWISSYGSPAASDGLLVMTGMFSRGDSVVAVRTDDGSKVFGHPADNGMLASATIVDDRVLFCSMKSILYCVQSSDGKVAWERTLGAGGGDANWSATTPAVKTDGDGTGIVVAGSGDGRMCGVDLADGTILWTHDSARGVFKVSPYRRDDRPLLSSPTIAGKQVFFGSADGHVYCLDLKTGEEQWKFVVGAPVMSTPLVTGNAVYVAAYDGRLYAFTSQADE